MDQIDVISHLESKIGKKLKHTSYDLIESWDLSFSVDAEGNVNGLNLSGLNLKSFPKEILDLHYLKILNLAGNRLSNIPPQLFDRPNLTTLRLEGNPIDPPPEIKTEGIISIKSYLSAINGESQPINEIRVILVGDGGSGKTSLVRRIKGEDFRENESKTDGINIDKLQISSRLKSEIKLRIWDFGGQEIMHSTHQFFLSHNTVYILVLDGRKDEKTEYWLKLIKTFGADSPILIILNKSDENPGFSVNESFLSTKYRSIKGYFKISCKSGTGINEFINGLHEEISNATFISTRIPKSWLRVKSKLDTENTDYISYNQYVALCREYKIYDNYSQTTLLKYLTNLGVVIHFDDINLRDTHVLNPDWLTSAVYAIINSPIVAESKGKININRIERIFRSIKDYSFPSDKYTYIISLLLKFEICYKLNEDELLLPDLLPLDETKYEFEQKGAIKVFFKYDFLPKSLFTRLISRLHYDTLGDKIWRTGVLLFNSTFNSKALLKLDEEDRKLYIYVNHGEKRNYLAVIRDTIKKLHQSYPNLFY